MIRKPEQRFPLLVRIGQILSVLIVALWAGSIGRQIVYTGDSYALEARNCVFRFYYSDTHTNVSGIRGFSVVSYGFRWFGVTLPRIATSGRYTIVQIPFWTFFLAMASPTAILWYRHHNRSKPGFCSKCRYDLAGNESGICPECGTKVKRP